jgi:hypothetical protein
MSDEKWEPWMTASIVLIERDGVVPVSARTLTALISYALAEPTSTVSQRLRDEAVSEAHDAICAAFAPPVPQEPDRLDDDGVWRPAPPVPQEADETRESCPGSGQPLLNPGHLFGTCSVCGRSLVVHDEGSDIAWPHDPATPPRPQENR